MTDKQFTYTGSDNLEAMQEAHHYNAFLVSLVEKAKIKSCGDILDIGAGIGLYAEMLREKGYRIFCFEPDTSQALLLQEKGFEVYTSLNEIKRQFDFAYAFNVLEHVENDAETLSEWAAKLKQNSKMLIYVPAFDLLFSSMDKKVGHFRRYTRKMLTRKTETAGLTVVKKARYADSIGFFVTLIYKLIGSKEGNLNKKSLKFYDKILFPVSRLLDIFFHKIAGKNVFIVLQNS